MAKYKGRQNASGGFASFVLVEMESNHNNCARKELYSTHTYDMNFYSLVNSF